MKRDARFNLSGLKKPITKATSCFLVSAFSFTALLSGGMMFAAAEEDVPDDEIVETAIETEDPGIMFLNDDDEPIDDDDDDEPIDDDDDDEPIDDDDDDEPSEKCEHDWEFVETVAPTCTEEGYDLYVCSICAETMSDNYVEATNHQNVIFVEAVEPTETENGNIAYWYCEDCGRYYSDEALENEIAQDDTIILSLEAQAELEAEESEEEKEEEELTEEEKALAEEEEASKTSSSSSAKGDSVKTSDNLSGIITSMIVMATGIFGFVMAFAKRRSFN